MGRKKVNVNKTLEDKLHVQLKWALVKHRGGFYRLHTILFYKIASLGIENEL
jgi:hypothetical protein